MSARPVRRRRPVRLAFPAARGVVRTESGNLAYEAALARRGLGPVAGTDEAGRGACAGPLMVGACILRPGRRGAIDGLTDSKLLTPAVREALYEQILAKAAAWSVVAISAAEIDRWGLHVANLAGMRRAVAALDVAPRYVLTDGFPVPGIGVPATAVWKGDVAVACIAAASILAKVTRDRFMTALAEQFPDYDFAGHKGYVTPEHAAALGRHGPCAQHRRRYINVRRAADLQLARLMDQTGQDGAAGHLPEGILMDQSGREIA